MVPVLAKCLKYNRIRIVAFFSNDPVDKTDMTVVRKTPSGDLYGKDTVATFRAWLNG